MSGQERVSLIKDKKIGSWLNCVAHVQFFSQQKFGFIKRVDKG